MRGLQGFFLSLIFHIFLVLIIQVLPTPDQPQKSITVDIIETPKKSQTETARNIIRDTVVPENMKTQNSDDNLRFLAEKTQRVKEQVRALQSGLTKNRGNQAPSPQKSAQQNHQAQQLKKNDLQKFLPAKNLIPKPQAATSAADEPGISTFGNIIDENVKVGSVTALNTDRYLYYSYFARAEELLRNEWEPQIIQIYDYPPSELKGVSANKFTTVLEVWFLPSGEFHSAHIMKPSGIKSFDLAATESFRRARMIPNPPKERVEKDGFVRFKWALTVEYNPKVLVRQTN